ncbi:MAG: hypothetical protein K0B10_14675 [Vicingaceae bacterium]|nr:hypothetical protein [Vicingaceae bacterium]
MKKEKRHIIPFVIELPFQSTTKIEAKKKKKESCCERFKKKGKGFCKSCPQNWA